MALLLYRLAAPALGAAIVLLVFGWHIVPTGNTGWMLSGTLGPDPVQYWLGWTFFRADDWRWPLGLNPRFGLEISSSIFYADALPLLAFLFKALRPIVEVGQYWGLWLVACGALQGWLAWRLAGLATPHVWGRMAAVVLFVLQPMLLNRMAGHFALAGQWLILWGLLLALTPGGRHRWAGWAALVLAASMIHSYILPMVLALWAADALRRRAWAELLSVPVAGVLGLWLAGFFALQAGHGGAAYGAMQLDLLAPFDPGYWGAFLPALPGPDHPEVGGSYLGLGALLLLPFALAAPVARRFWPLIAVLAGMLVFAVTHRPSLGGMQTTLFELPFAELAGALRASERYFWPAGYALILAGIAGLTRLLGARVAGPALLLLAAVQVADLRPGIARIATFFAPPEPIPILKLQDPVWSLYPVIRAVPAANQGLHWEEIAVAAATRRLTTDAIYLARADPARIAALREAVLARLREGRPEPGTLYVLRNAEALAAARAGGGQPRLIDGLMILAPEAAASR